MAHFIAILLELDWDSVTVNPQEIVHEHNSGELLKQAALMHWAEVIEDPSLRDLPFKIETNRFGQIVMSPATRGTSRYRGIIVGLLFSMKVSGELHSGCPVETAEGVKVPDATWVSEA